MMNDEWFYASIQQRVIEYFSLIYCNDLGHPNKSVYESVLKVFWRSDGCICLLNGNLYGDWAHETNTYFIYTYTHHFRIK